MKNLSTSKINNFEVEEEKNFIKFKYERLNSPLEKSDDTDKY